MRRGRTDQRAATEKRSAEVGAPAARLGDQPLWRTRQGPVRAVEHTGCGERRECVLRSFHVQLVSRRTVERTPSVGADLGFDVERPEERERAARDGRAREIEVEGDLAAAAQVEPAGG